jgi:hypothetical protein
LLFAVAEGRFAPLTMVFKQPSTTANYGKPSQTTVNNRQPA